jgi:hypothetical protein
MESKEYLVGNKVYMADAPDGKFFVLRTGLMLGRLENGDALPNNNVPLRNIVGVDKDAIKAMICDQIDDLFDVIES